VAKLSRYVAGDLGRHSVGYYIAKTSNNSTYSHKSSVKQYIFYIIDFYNVFKYM
jgi:hypothetical protein